LTLLARYLWYRRGGCSHDLASERVLHPSAGELRLCGDPFGAGEWPSVDDTFRFRLRLETSLRSASAPVAPTRVDAEGEAVWLQKYLTERLGGRDAYGARVEVQNAIRPFRRPGTR